MDHGKGDTWQMNSRVRGRFLSLEGSKKKNFVGKGERKKRKKKGKRERKGKTKRKESV